MRHRLVIFGLIIAAIVAAALFLQSVGFSNVIGSGQAFAEKTAVSTLRTLHWAQGSFREHRFVDDDGDGIGEFGTMLQLAGTGPLRNGKPIEASLVPMAGSQFAGEVLVAGGFCFRYDLPEGPDARERRFVAYGWPVVAAAGHKLFCINQDEDILESANAAGYVGPEKAPPVGSCPSAAAVDAGGTGWVRWRGKTSQLKVGAAE